MATIAILTRHATVDAILYSVEPVTDWDTWDTTDGTEPAPGPGAFRPLWSIDTGRED